MNKKFLGHIKFLPSLLWFMNFRISIIKSSLQWKCQTQQRKRFLSIFSAYHHARYLLNMWLIYCVFELECVPHVFGNFHTFIWEKHLNSISRKLISEHPTNITARTNVGTWNYDGRKIKNCFLFPFCTSLQCFNIQILAKTWCRHVNEMRERSSARRGLKSE